MRPVIKWMLISGCWFVWGLFNASRLKAVIPQSTWGQALEYAMPDALIWAALTPGVLWLVSVLPVRPGNLLHRVPLHLALAVLIAVIHSLFDTLANVLLGTSLTFSQLFAKILRHTLHLNVLVYIVIASVDQSLRRYLKTQEQSRRNAELRAQLSSARLASLEAQLRPHFLFNTLHTISGLMDTDPKAGRQVVCRLSDLLRSSLRNGEQREISVERELEHARAYLEIERVRFAGRLEASVRGEPAALSCAVPNFILQPIVENAVHHGLADAAGSVEVTAACRNGKVELQVRDSGSDREAENPGHGVGLANTAARLRELYGDEAGIDIRRLDGGGSVVTIRLPRREAR